MEYAIGFLVFAAFGIFGPVICLVTWAIGGLIITLALCGIIAGAEWIIAQIKRALRFRPQRMSSRRIAGMS